MAGFTENLNLIASLGTIAGQIFLVTILILWLFSRFGKGSVKSRSIEILRKAGSWGLVSGFVVVLTSVVLSLVYSDFIGFEPCKLCWIQRIFLYPQAVILGLALWKKSRDAETYCLALSTIGATIALYHYYGENFNPSALPACDAGGAISCAVRFVAEFGYITIPLMSLTAFLLII